MVTAIAIVAIIWLIAFILLMTPSTFWASNWDRITKARWRKDKINLQIMLDHLRTKPDEWAISREGASFPKDSRAKKIYLTYDKGQLNYTLNSFDTKSRVLDGHFGKEFETLIRRHNDNVEKEALLRDFWPNYDGQRLLA